MECPLSYLWAWQISWDIHLKGSLYQTRILDIRESTMNSAKSNRRIKAVTEFQAGAYFLYTKASTISAMLRATKKWTPCITKCQIYILEVVRRKEILKWKHVQLEGLSSHEKKHANIMLHWRLCSQFTYTIPTEKETCENPELDGDSRSRIDGH
jgi:hypothetical protein